MYEFLVHNVEKDKETDDFITVVYSLEEYCNLLTSRLYFIMYHYEQVTGKPLSEDYALRSNLLNVIGLAKRLPQNIYVGDPHE